MRIGITCYPTYGGSGIVATELGLELANRGHEVHFISYANPIRLDPGIPRIHYHEVEVSQYPLFYYPPYCLALASRMAEVAERYELDLLHVHYAIPHSISALLAQQMLEGRRKLPFITTLHGTDITLVGADRSYFPITKFSIERSNGITTISEYMQKRTTDVFGIRNEIRVIYNFVNVDLYKPDPESKPERKDSSAHLELPSRETRSGLHSNPRRGPQDRPRPFADGGRWPRTRTGRDVVTRPRRRKRRHVPGEAGSCRAADP